MSIRVVNWGRFQHYKNRNPPWIKLHRALLDNREWDALSPEAAKLLIACWLLASEYDDGVIPMDTAALAWRLRRTDVAALAATLSELASHGFLELAGQDASKTLAQPEQDARQRRGEEREVEVSRSLVIHPLRATEDVDPEHLITLAIRAANAGQTDNPRIDQPRFEPIMANGKERGPVRDWFDAGYPWELVLDTVYFAARDYKPGDRQIQIKSMRYFEVPIANRIEREASRAFARPTRNEIHPEAEVNRVRSETPGASRAYQEPEKVVPFKLSRILEEMQKQGLPTLPITNKQQEDVA